MKKYNVAVAGTGYVGMSLATLLAQHNSVKAVDIVPEKVEMINGRKSPIRDEYIENLTDSGYIINDNHRRVKIDVNDNDDILYLMSMRVGAAYEREQATTGSDEFITVQRNKQS